MLSKQTIRFKDILPKIEYEVKDISRILQDNSFALFGKYTLHRVPISGTTFFAADAKSMNRFDHQSGRGCWRYLFSPEMKQYVGIAKEVDNGSYKML
ncbi:MAG: hypothetical protein WC758_00770 [Candidatus Woesearchaeota archaeon]|jgi:hypothetical protein